MSPGDRVEARVPSAANVRSGSVPPVCAVDAREPERLLAARALGDAPRRRIVALATGSMRQIMHSQHGSADGQEHRPLHQSERADGGRRSHRDPSGSTATAQAASHLVTRQIRTLPDFPEGILSDSGPKPDRFT